MPAVPLPAVPLPVVPLPVVPLPAVPLPAGTPCAVPLVAGRDVVVTMPRNWRQKAAVKVVYDSPLTAPVAKGDTIGKLTVSGEGVPHLEVPLMAADDVSRLALPGRAMAVLSHFMTGS